MDFVKGIRPYFYLHSQWNSHFRWVTVEGLSHLDVRHLAEKIGEQPEQQSERDKTAEFSIPTWMVCIEMMAEVVMVKVKVLDYMFFFIAGSQWLGAPWIQGGDLRPICDRPRPLRPARVCVDSAQKQRGLGNQLIVKLRGQIREKIFFQQCLSLYLQPRDPNNNPQTSKTQDLTFGSCHPVLVAPLKLCEW